MSELTQIEREAKLTRDFIAELKGLTPKFNATKERAEEELRLHLAKIDGERAKLRELIDAAAVIVQNLGREVGEPTHTEAEVAAVMAEDAEPTERVLEPSAELEAAMAGGPVTDDLCHEAEPHEFQSIGEIAAEVTAAVAAIADEQAGPDLSDEPEMTDEQVERAEETIASAEPRPARMFNAFAANPFA